MMLGGPSNGKNDPGSPRRLPRGRVRPPRSPPRVPVPREGPPDPPRPGGGVAGGDRLPGPGAPGPLPAEFGRRPGPPGEAGGRDPARVPREEHRPDRDDHARPPRPRPAVPGKRGGGGREELPAAGAPDPARH